MWLRIGLCLPVAVGGGWCHLSSGEERSAAGAQWGCPVLRPLSQPLPCVETIVDCVLTRCGKLPGALTPVPSERVCPLPLRP